MSYFSNNEFYENEESLVYYVITSPDDSTIDRFIGDISELSDEELTILKATYVGAVICRPTKSYSVISEENLPVAFPIESHIKKYPTFNEVVITSKFFGKLYYWSLNTLGNINTAAQLVLRNSYKANPDNKGAAGKDNESISSGIANSDSSDESEKLGVYFEGNPTVHSLLPYEGDVLLEGRFGNSIRFGGYNVGDTNNSFKDDNPQILIRNAENVDSQNDKKLGEFTEEDINTDGSSIHMTSGDIASPFQSSVDVDIIAFENYPSELTGDQIAINADRLILSSKASELIGIGKSAIGFLTDGLFTIDSKGSISFVAQDSDFLVSTTNVKFKTDNGKIFLGDPDNEEQPLVLGKQLTDWLEKLMDELINETHPTAVGPSGLPSNQSKYRQLKRELKQILSSKNFTI